MFLVLLQIFVGPTKKKKKKRKMVAHLYLFLHFATLLALAALLSQCRLARIHVLNLDQHFHVCDKLGP